MVGKGLQAGRDAARGARFAGEVKMRGMDRWMIFSAVRDVALASRFASGLTAGGYDRRPSFRRRPNGRRIRPPLLSDDVGLDFGRRRWIPLRRSAA